jgi:hypothetical protein
MEPQQAERVVTVKAATTGVVAEVAEVDGADGATAVTTGAKEGRIESKRPEHIVKRWL